MELIRTEELKKSYGASNKNVEVLKGISLTINRGETVAIVGASGVGKSTFLNLLGGLDRPTSGEVYYEGKPVFKHDDRKLAAFRNSTIGFVFQFHHLLPEFTALENVVLPALIGGATFNEAAERATGLLVEVGLKDRLNHKPGELSGGEQQRTAMVRALMRSPSVILADEPTGNLDSRTGEEVFDILMEQNRSRGMTMIIVTHNERLAGRLNRRLRMVDGNIIEE
jgi:lipoprotein-releasing system ATP-binding protein